MPDYDFRGLSARSFEQLVQALSTQVLGPGVVIFGDGPDGGREATFEGKVPFPSSEEQWDGYIVIQAKFRARPETTARDGTWLMRELKKELPKFTRRRLRRPEYYILCSNVVLTPVNARGTKDTTNAIFEKYRAKLGLKGYAVWDYDTLRSFLDSYASVRQTYGAWVTPGDVLAEILREIQFDRPDFADVVHNFIQKELLADRFANLEQAGYKADDRIPLGQVFVDLPASPERFVSPPPADADAKLLGCVTSIVAESSERLSESCRSSQPSSERRTSLSNAGRFVVVGGPGQGKTTVGQFLCQMYRAALISGRPRAKLSKEVKDALGELKVQAAAENLALPTARRFPIRIILSEFADALATKNVPPITSLLAYISQRMASVTAFDLSTRDVRRWLGAYPWFLVLDGLDEVPASGNRDLLLAKIQEFWVDVSDVDGDVLVFATTRPQGYSDDFSQRYYQHLWLAPLSPRRAIHYAGRFTAARFGNDIDRALKVMRRLQRAAAHDSTARIMQSPLQITIMAILVDQGGEPPRERWRLFRQYYDVIYRREVERWIAAASVLQEYEADIEAIHSSVGLLLQIESERTGNAEAKLPASRFRAVVERRLRNEGHDGVGLSALTEQIIYAASIRLVFLVGLESGFVGFEIRSLQEFMAAEGLMAGGDEDAANRLSAIAALTGWRNVFLFAAGKCFADRQYMRDVICNIASALNDAPDDRIARHALAGSLLAADILEDGAARQQPKYYRQLTRLALRALDVMSFDTHQRLAKLYDESVGDIYADELLTRLTHQDVRRRHAAWNAIVPLAAASIAWANDALRDRWPTDLKEQIVIAEIAGIAGLPSELFHRVADLAPYVRSWQITDSWHEMAALKAWPPDQARWLRNLASLDSLSAEERISVKGPRDPLGFVVNRVSVSKRRLRVLENVLSDVSSWTMAEASAQFLRSGDAAGLTRALLTLAQAPEAELPYRFVGSMPWPLGAVLAGRLRDRDELRRLARLAADGMFGSFEDWLNAERRWLSTGVTMDDVRYMEDDSHWPYDEHIAEKGFPFAAAALGRSHSAGGAEASALFGVCSSLERSQLSLFRQICG